MPFGPFSTLPNGLGNLFGLTGQALPKALEDYVQSQLEIMPWIAGANCTEFFGTPPFAAAAVGLVNINVGPQPGEAWLVRGASAGWTTGAGQKLRGQLQLAIGAAAGAVPITGGTEATSGAAAGVGEGRSFLNGPFLMFPGDALVVDVFEIAGGPINIFGAAAIFRFNA